ncbi:MAG: hypothetical protein JW727_02710 [Candidatus Aenigmarchaeota archaeon]|nr:hypothetical protein [Candidatus Aenigmarchaeota archaeon]
MSQDGIVVEKAQGSVLVKIAPKIYPLPIIYQAADVFIDKNYVFLDGDPEKEVLVTIKPKDSSADLEAIAGDFHNELLNYSAYFVRAATNRDLRELILKRAFFSVKMDAQEDEAFREKLDEKEVIDIGTKVPIFGDLEQNEQTPLAGGCGSRSSDAIWSEEDDFDLDEISKPWDEQKGKMDSLPKQLKENHK